MLRKTIYNSLRKLKEVCMPINFIPNDPFAGTGAPPMRQVKAHANRASTRAGFIFHSPVSQGLNQPGTPDFLFWQCRQAAISGMKAWELHAGILRNWFNGRRIHLVQNAVAEFGAPPDLNAYYDRTSFQFFEFTGGGKTTFSGESTDVVAHEIGHGLLDAIRPDLWDTPYLEVNAFHEAFGDCMALLTALADSKTRQAFLSRRNNHNFLETTAEDLSEAIRRVAPNHNAAAPRRALNTLNWQLPSTLPNDGGPGVLINESHSFAQIFNGCFYDLMRNLVGSTVTQTALRHAVRTAGRLLVAGARNAPESLRFFQAVGRAMSLADQEINDGANRDAIGQAFGSHNIALGTNAMLAPVAALSGASPRATARAASISRTTTRDLAGRLGVRRGERMRVQPVDIGKGIVKAVHEREIPLGDVHSKLKGVVALAPESVLVGSSGGYAAALGALPEARATIDEVLSYVDTLVKHERIAFEGKTATSKKGGKAPVYITHMIKAAKGKKILSRVRFAC
jgi:Fungalysin metallopeptidase (M36)